MIDSARYGDVALGIECALPAVFLPRRRHGRVRLLVAWLMARLVRRN
jgi:hypothetical protein